MNNIKYLLSDIQQYAKLKYGILLTKEYINNKQLLEWQCEKGHVWKTSWQHVKNKKTWCPTCSNCAKANIKELQRYAKSKNGLLLTKKYKSSHSLMEWQCKDGHIWKATWSNIKNQNQWCKQCFYNKPSIKDINNFISVRGGFCISNEYINNQTIMEWQCKKGHVWGSNWNNIKAGRWCPNCAKKAKPTILQLKQYAKFKNGSCLSTEYKHNLSKLHWQCEKGHIWLNTWSSIQQGSWCPECSLYKTELLCKKLLEQKLKLQFTKIRFFYNDKRYELDGYNEKFKIAFEYNGYQHYVYPNHFHKTKKQFQDNQQRDIDKKQYCINNGIKLIVVPYTEQATLAIYIKNLKL